MILCLFIVALPAEARPLVEHYRLKPQNNLPYRFYRNDSIALVETGLGKLNAAAASSAALCTLLATQGRAPVCINVGLAGSDNPIGSLMRAHRVTDADTQQKWYPQQTWSTSRTNTAVASIDLYTVSRPDNRYQSDKAFDMEASGVMSSATKYTTLEFVQCLKIVSDNPQSAIANINKEMASELIDKNTQTIAHCAEQLATLNSTLPDNSALDATLHIISTHYKPSSTHKAQLSNLLQRYQTLKSSLPQEHELLSHDNTRALLQSMQSILDQHKNTY